MMKPRSRQTRGVREKGRGEIGERNLSTRPLAMDLLLDILLNQLTRSLGILIIRTWQSRLASCLPYIFAFFSTCIFGKGCFQGLEPVPGDLQGTSTCGSRVLINSFSGSRWPSRDQDTTLVNTCSLLVNLRLNRPLEGEVQTLLFLPSVVSLKVHKHFLHFGAGRSKVGWRKSSVLWIS